MCHLAEKSTVIGPPGGGFSSTPEPALTVLLVLPRIAKSCAKKPEVFFLQVSAILAPTSVCSSHDLKELSFSVFEVSASHSPPISCLDVCSGRIVENYSCRTL